MGVERTNAVVNNALILRNSFRYSQTDDYFDPYEISKVEILSADGVTVLETHSGAAIQKDSTGKYHVDASAVATAQTIYDKWYFTPSEGADEITKTNTCVVWATSTGDDSGPELTPGTNSYCTETEMDAYFLTRFGASDIWDDLTNLQKRSAMITAYKRIVSHFENLPATATAGMKDAQCEMALFIAIEGLDTMRRQGLQAQGVVQAGIAKEGYDPAARGAIAFPPEVLTLLKDYTARDDGAFAGEVSRDDTEDVT